MALGDAMMRGGIAEVRAARFNMLRNLKDRVRAAERELAEAIAITFPVDKAITWKRGRGDGSKYGHVVMHGDHERIKIRNDDTGKDYWITLYDVLEANDGYFTE